MTTTSKVLGAVASVVCLELALGVAIASNVAFKLPYTLTGPAASGGQGTGKNLISLPYRRKPSLNNAYDLMLDIGGGSITPVLNVSKYNTATDTLITYTGRMGAGAPFALTAGENYLVQLNTNVNYIIVGAHDSAVTISLTNTGASSLSGKHWLAVPYNSTAATVYDLMLDIGGGSIADVANISRYNRATDAYATYTGRMGAGAPFAVVAGEGYLVQMNITRPYVPAHY